ncbi:hypothetical protein JHK85_005266 [Glycine max]|nr:hypothetical protein JHK85_005266 [Glycine max]
MKWESITLSSPTPCTPNSNTNWLVMEDNNSRSTKWTSEENKLFENALAVHDKDTPDRWHRVAEMIPGKTVVDVIRQYKELEVDVSNIEAGLIPVPGYSSTATSPFTLDWVNTPGYDGFKGCGKRSSSVRPIEHERKKGVPWTEDEHKIGGWSLKLIKARVNLTETITTSSEDTNGSSSPHVLSQQQQPNSTPTTPRTRFQWSNQSNTGVAMTLNPAHERVFMSHYGANSFGVKIEGQNLHESSYLRPQTQNMVFQMQQSSQH